MMGVIGFSGVFVIHLSYGVAGFTAACLLGMYLSTLVRTYHSYVVKLIF